MRRLSSWTNRMSIFSRLSEVRLISSSGVIASSGRGWAPLVSMAALLRDKSVR